MNKLSVNTAADLIMHAAYADEIHNRSFDNMKSLSMLELSVRGRGQHLQKLAFRQLTFPHS